MYGENDLNPTRCHTWVTEQRGWSHQCLHKPTVTREDKLYCKVHDPEYIKAKNAQWRTAFNAEQARKQAIYTLEDARQAATQGLTLEELKQVTPDLIRQRILTHDVNKLKEEI